MLLRTESEPMLTKCNNAIFFSIYKPYQFSKSYHSYLGRRDLEMKIQVNSSYAIHYISFVMLFLCGCGNENLSVINQKETIIKQEEISYMTQDISLPEYDSLDGAYSDGSTLYYAATGFEQTSQQNRTTFYSLKEGDSIPEILFSLPENQSVTTITMDENKNIYYLGHDVSKPNDDHPILYKVDLKGTLLLTLSLSEYIKEQEQAVIQGIAVDGENYMVLFDSNQNIFIFNPNGELLFKDRMPDIIYNICSNNGKIFVGYRSSNGMSIKEIDIPGRKLTAKLEHIVPGDKFYMTSGSGKNLLISSAESLYEYSLEEESLVKKFDWQTYDFAGISAGILLPLNTNGILAISRNYSAVPMKVEVVAFREASEGEIALPEKLVLTLGTLSSLPSGLNAEIVYFNKNNPEYKIEVINYEEDFMRLNTEIMAGNGPDFLSMPFDRIASFATRGVVEDLNPYFDEDKTLNRSDFLENILNAFETDGFLYGIPAIKFRIYTLVGKSSLLENKSSWDLDELIAFTKNFSEETDVFDSTSKSGVLRLIKTAYTNQLVNIDDTITPLNCELLIKMLLFANQYANDDQYIYDANLSGKIMGEQLILPDIIVTSGHDFFGCSSLFGEPVTYIGYPTVEGNGNLIVSSQTFAINSGSKYKDISWKFISTLLSKESQMRMEKNYTTMGFHLRKEALEEHFSYIKKNASGYAMCLLISDHYTAIKFNLGDVKEEHIDQIRSLIQNADTTLITLPDIDKIIEEEAIFYFNGTKPVEEVVDVIENRVRTYVNEMK